MTATFSSISAVTDSLSVPLPNGSSGDYVLVIVHMDSDEAANAVSHPTGWGLQSEQARFPDPPSTVVFYRVRGVENSLDLEFFDEAPQGGFVPAVLAVSAVGINLPGVFAPEPPDFIGNIAWAWFSYWEDPGAAFAEQLGPSDFGSASEVANELLVVATSTDGIAWSDLGTTVIEENGNSGQHLSGRRYTDVETPITGDPIGDHFTLYWFAYEMGTRWFTGHMGWTA